MKNLKRLVSLTVALAATMSIFSGCSKPKDSADKNQVANAAVEKANIQFFTWTTGAKEIMEPLIDKYNQTNKDGVTVELLMKSGDWQTALRTSIAAGQTPDLMYGVQDLNEAINNKWIEPWDNYVSDELKKRTKDIAYNVSVAGKPQTYGYISSVKTYRFAYNTDIFKELGITAPPKTWEEFYSLAKTITEKGNGKYYGTALPVQKNGLIYWATPTLSFEGRYINGVDFKTNKVDYSVLTPYIKIWRDLYQNKIAMPGSESMDNDAVRAQFAAGKVAMLPAVSWDVATINVQYKGTANWTVSDALLPTGGQKGQSALRETPYYNLSAISKYKKQAGKFLEFLLGDEYLGKQYSECSDMITIQSAIDSTKGVKFSQPQWPLFAVKPEEVKYSPANFSSQTVGDILDVMLSGLVLDKNKDIDKALQDLNKRTTEGIIKQAKTDLEKAKQSGSQIDKVGKIPTIEGYDPMKPLDVSKIKYVTAEEWEKMQN
jgi:multiple sugar transport system substrate-binding protein